MGSREICAQTATDEVSDWRVSVALVLVQVAFAAGAVEGKLAMATGPLGGQEGGHVSPLALAMARMLGGAVFFQCALRWAAPRRKPTLPEHGKLIGLSLLGVVLNQGLFLIGLHMTTAFSAALLTAIIPVFTAVIAVVLRQERASAPMAAGLFLAVGGVLSLTGLHAVDRGALIVTANCLSYSLYLVLARPIIRRLGPRTSVAWVYAYGMLIFSPIGMVAIARELPTWSLRSWVLVGFMVIGPTIFSYAANAWALARASSSVVAVFIYLQPLFAALIAWAQLGQGLTARMMIATVLIFSGVGVVLAPSLSRPPLPQAGEEAAGGCRRLPPDII